MARGAIWLADLSPTRGREQSGRRPVALVSRERFNSGGASLVIVCPLTTTERGIRSHIRVVPPEGGLRLTSFIMTEAVRSISKQRLLEPWGCPENATLERVEDVLRILLHL